MIDEVLEQTDLKQKPGYQKTVLATRNKAGFIPQRFSVRKLRKHPGIQANRNPIVIA